MRPTSEIESGLVDAIETEAKDFQALDRTWPAVHAAIAELRARDTEIEALRARLLSTEEAERLRHAVSVAECESQVSEDELPVLDAAIGRVTSGSDVLTRIGAPPAPGRTELLISVVSRGRRPCIYLVASNYAFTTEDTPASVEDANRIAAEIATDLTGQAQEPTGRHVIPVVFGAPRTNQAELDNLASVLRRRDEEAHLLRGWLAETLDGWQRELEDIVAHRHAHDRIAELRQLLLSASIEPRRATAIALLDELLTILDDHGAGEHHNSGRTTTCAFCKRIAEIRRFADLAAEPVETIRSRVRGWLGGGQVASDGFIGCSDESIDRLIDAARGP